MLPRRRASIHVAAAKHRGSRLSVAVLYSGRFYGELTLPAWSTDHLENLIVPNQATVFVVADPVNICDTSSTVHHAIRNSSWETASLALLHAAKSVFGGWPHLFAKVVPSVNHGHSDISTKLAKVYRQLKRGCACARDWCMPREADAHSLPVVVPNPSPARLFAGPGAARRRGGPQRLSGGNTLCRATARPPCTTGRSSST